MKQDSSDAILAVVVVTIIVFFLGVWRFADAIGPTYLLTQGAIVRSVFIVVLAGAAIWFFEIPLAATMTAALAVMAPQWWYVIDSIAVGGHPPHEAFVLRQVWWASDWMEWGIEIGLAIPAVWLFYRCRDRL